MTIHEILAHPDYRRFAREVTECDRQHPEAGSREEAVAAVNPCRPGAQQRFGW